MAAFAATARTSNAAALSETGIGVYVFDSSTRPYPVLISYDDAVKRYLLRNSLVLYRAIGVGMGFLATRVEFSRADDRFDQRDGWGVRIHI